MEFIINTNMIWDTPPTARHQLAEALVTKGYRVTFITGNKFGKPGIEIKKINDLMQVLTPTFPFSRRLRYRLPFFNELYQRWLYPKLAKRFAKNDVYLITSDFGGYLIANYFKKRIYFASDDYINNVKTPTWMSKYTYWTQKNLVKSVDFTISTAKKLVNDFTEFNPNSYELPLGAPDFQYFGTSEQDFKPRNGTIKVVLLGFIDRNKTPVSLLNKILEMGNTQLYLIGPIKDDILSHLKFPDHVFALGIQTKGVLFETLRNMDVGIAPYYMEDPNSGRTPNKMWQYLAAGKPAVITNLPNVRHWTFPEGTVFKANTEEEFVNQIKEAYATDTPDLVEKRMDLAKNNSWGKRADQLLDYIKNNKL